MRGGNQTLNGDPDARADRFISLLRSAAGTPVSLNLIMAFVWPDATCADIIDPTTSVRDLIRRCRIRRGLGAITRHRYLGFVSYSLEIDHGR